MIGHGGLLRALSFARPIRCSGHVDMPRPLETWVSLCNLMLKLCGISCGSAFFGSDRPQSNNRRDNFLLVTPFITRERPNIKLASTDARAALVPKLSGGTRVRHWQSAQKLWPDTRRPQLPLDDCCRLVLPYHAIQHATDGTDQ